MGLVWCTPWFPAFQTKWDEIERGPTKERNLASYEIFKVLISILPVSKAVSFYSSVTTGAHDVIASYQIVTGSQSKKYLRYCFATEPCDQEDSWEEMEWRSTGEVDTWEDYIDVYARPTQQQDIPIYGITPAPPA